MTCFACPRAATQALREMAGTVWALGAIGSVPSETLLPLLIRRSAERLDAAGGMDLANLLWGFARLDCPISQGTTDRFAVRFWLWDTVWHSGFPRSAPS